jgi:sulfonate transport system permease protein
MRPFAWRLASLAFVLAALFGWREIAAFKLVSPVFLPSPERAFAALWLGLTHADLSAKLAGTIEHMIAGWLLASVVGIALGALIGSHAGVRAYVAPTLEFLRPLPASAIIPVAIAIFGLSSAMALGVIGFGAVWPMLLATMHGFAAVEPRLKEVARVLGLNGWETAVKISLPAAAPDILAGLRLGLTVALILAVVCEMIAGLDGLGQWVLLAARAYRSADLFAGVILLGVIGLVANALLSLVEARALRWRVAHGR